LRRGIDCCPKVCFREPRVFGEDALRLPAGREKSPHCGDGDSRAGKYRSRAKASAPLYDPARLALLITIEHYSFGEFSLVLVERQGQFHDDLTGQRLGATAVRFLDPHTTAAPQLNHNDPNLSKGQREATLSQLAHDLAEELKRHLISQGQRHANLDQVRE
jgi:hypothetical protein